MFNVEVYKNGAKGIDWYPHSTGYETRDKAVDAAVNVTQEGVTKVRVLDLGVLGARNYEREVVFEYARRDQTIRPESCAIGKFQLPENPDEAKA